ALTPLLRDEVIEGGREYLRLFELLIASAGIEKDSCENHVPLFGMHVSRCEINKKIRSRR
ncbi:MAG: hypothetical protein ABW278_05595, partial [Steroidobacteraceae bacterium]